MAGIVLGVAMTPTKVRMVLVEGESADGVTVDEDDFDVDTRRTALPGTAPDQVISAILGTWVPPTAATSCCRPALPGPITSRRLCCATP